MRILLVHNAYRQRGGEDAVFEDERTLLAQHDHEVHTLERHNDEIGSAWRHAADAVWSRTSRTRLAGLLADFRPEVVHVHNTWPLVSPAVLAPAAAAGAAVVATLHNYRLACLQGAFLRDGRPCEDCLGRLPWRGVARRCYRDAFAPSAVLAASLAVHRALGSWPLNVHRFIALHRGAVDKFVAAGLPRERLCVKPNFAWPNPLPDGPRSGGLFVGRLTSDKGLALLAAALRQVPELAFDVAGSGPDAALLDGSGARMLGALGRAEVQAAMRRAAFLLVPSSRAEQFPRVLAEAFASGLPVIVAGFGALAEWVDDGRTGLHFRFGDAGDLAVRLRWALAHPAEMAALGRAARADYERRFGPEAAHAALMSIYAEARATAAGR